MGTIDRSRSDVGAQHLEVTPGRALPGRGVLHRHEASAYQSSVVGVGGSSPSGGARYPCACRIVILMAPPAVKALDPSPVSGLLAAMSSRLMAKRAPSTSDAEYWQTSGFWVLAIDDSAGGGGVEIDWCPHCGRSLAHNSAASGWPAAYHASGSLLGVTSPTAVRGATSGRPQARVQFVETKDVPADPVDVLDEGCVTGFRARPRPGARSGAALAPARTRAGSTSRR